MSTQFENAVYYNNTLGVFNLSSPPVVKYKVVRMYPPPPPGYKDVQYLVQLPLGIVLNPAIANEVTVGPLSVTLIYMKQYSGKDVSYNPNLVARLRAEERVEDFPKRMREQSAVLKAPFSCQSGSSTSDRPPSRPRRSYSCCWQSRSPYCQ
jgi:hypothetical protein